MRCSKNIRHDISLLLEAMECASALNEGPDALRRVLFDLVGDLAVNNGGQIDTEAEVKRCHLARSHRLLVVMFENEADKWTVCDDLSAPIFRTQSSRENVAGWRVIEVELKLRRHKCHGQQALNVVDDVEDVLVWAHRFGQRLFWVVEGAMDLVEVLAQVQLREVALKHVFGESCFLSQLGVRVWHHVLVSEYLRLWQRQLGDDIAARGETS